MHITPNPIEMMQESACTPPNHNVSENIYSDSYFHNIFQMPSQGKSINNGRPPVPPNPPSPMPFNLSNGTLRRINKNAQLNRQKVGFFSFSV